MRDFHTTLAWVIVFGNGLVGAWALAAHRVTALRGRLLWVLTGIAQVAVLAQAWVGAIWINADGGIGDGVCCSFTAPVFEILLADGTDQLGWPWSTYRQSMGLLVWPALAARKVVGANVDFLLWLNLAVVIATQVLLYTLGKRLSGRFAGLIAAGLFPMIPAVTLMTRRWDAMKTSGTQ